MNKKDEIKIFYSTDWEDYKVLDTGESERLEQVGGYKFVRPYENAVWQKTLSKTNWEKVDGKFWSSKSGGKGGWKMNSKLEPEWKMSYKGVSFYAAPTPFRHFGFFPEQASHWDFIEAEIKKAVQAENFSKAGPKFLNLFGYTGIASLFALRAGAEVTHLDASKQSLAWAKKNQILSGMESKPMRIICDDVLKFLQREEKRGNKYDCVIMDPPKFGRGPKGETWKIEEMLPSLLKAVRKVLSEKPIFVILTSYATDSSSLSLSYALAEAMKDFSGQIEKGELCVQEESKGRLISLANTTIWRSF